MTKDGRGFGATVPLLLRCEAGRVEMCGLLPGPSESGSCCGFFLCVCVFFSPPQVVVVARLLPDSRSRHPASAAPAHA